MLFFRSATPREAEEISEVDWLFLLAASWDAFDSPIGEEGEDDDEEEEEADEEDEDEEAAAKVTVRF